MKRKIKMLKAFKGAQADTKKGQAMSPGTGATGGSRGTGRDPSAQFSGNQTLSPQAKAILQSQRKKIRTTISPSTSTSAQLTAMALGTILPGAGYAYKKFLDANPPYLRSKTKKTKTPVNIPTGGGGGDNNVKPIVAAPIVKKPTFILPKKDFFPFRAYNSGGVSKGPPPLRGPNSQVPPVKMNKGNMTKKYKMSCPHRPDGIRGVGASIKGHKFIGVK